MNLESTRLEVIADDLTLTREAASFGAAGVFSSFPPGSRLLFDVFKTVLRQGSTRKTVYCCLSGGEVRDGDAALTLVGRAALTMLLLIPTPPDTPITLQELRIGKIPLRTKVQRAVKNAPAGRKICFFGDMSGELDGKALDSLGWNQTIERVYR